jgi:membrane protein required for colicin V production
VTAVEWALLAVIGAGALVGLLRGAVKGFIDLVSLAIGAASAAYAIPWIDDRLVGYGINSRLLLIVIAVVLVGVVTATCGLVLRLVAAPLGLAKAIPPFGWLDRLAGMGPGLIKGGLTAIGVVAVVLVQFPDSAIGEEIRSSELGDRLAQAGSIGFERATAWTGRDLHALSARDVGPGQTWTGPADLPSGNLRPDGAMEETVRELIDDAREREGLPALRSDDELAEIAREHAQGARGAENRRLSSAIEDVGDRLAEDGHNCLAVGAVLGTGDSAAELVDSLLESEQHRDIVLSNTYVFAGFGVVAGTNGDAILVGVFVF